MTSSHITYFSRVSVCCLALHVYIAHDVAPIYLTVVFPPLPCVRLVVLVQQEGFRRINDRVRKVKVQEKVPDVF